MRDRSYVRCVRHPRIERENERIDGRKMEWAHVNGKCADAKKLRMDAKDKTRPTLSSGSEEFAEWSA